MTPRQHEIRDRFKKIHAMGREGRTLAEISAAFGISRARAHQILQRRRIPKWVHDKWTPAEDLVVVALPVREAAEKLNRSVTACIARRVRLRKKGGEIPDQRGKK